MKYRLLYFDFKGKGELARLVFAAAKVEYEDKRIEYSLTSEEWLNYKPTATFGKLPILEILDENNCVVYRLAQSVAIGNRTFIKLSFFKKKLYTMLCLYFKSSFSR